MSRFFVIKAVTPKRTLETRDSDRYRQTELQAQASDVVARREYLQRYSIEHEVQS